MFRSSINSVWDYWENLHPFLRFFIACLVLGLLGWFGVKPGYRAFKAWRMNQNLVAAKVASDEVRMSDARDLSLTVLRAGDPRIDAFRILEKSMDSLRDARHGDIARALMQHPQSTESDRLIGFTALTKEVPLSLVGQAWASLPEGFRSKSSFTKVFADRLLVEKKASEAVSVLLAAQERQRSEVLSLLLTKVLVMSGKKQGFDQAQADISEGINQPNADVNAWLDLLETIPVLSLNADKLGSLENLLAKDQRVSRSRAAAVLGRLAYIGDYNNRSATVDKLCEQLSGTDSLARLLLDLGLTQRAESLFPAKSVVEQPGLAPVLLEIYWRNSSWDQINTLLDVGGAKLSKLEVDAYRAFTAKEKGDLGTAVQSWSTALGEAKSTTQRGAYMTLYRLAAERGQVNYAEQALVEAIRDGKGALPLYSDLGFLLESLSKQGKENILLEICANYLAYENGNIILLTQYAYLACLNNLADPEIVLKAMEPLAKAYPAEIPIQCVLAFVYLAANQVDNAFKAIEALKVAPEKLNPSYRAIYLSIQLASKRMKVTDPLVVKFDMTHLLPSEKKKFELAISRAAVP
jgi:hypothetical protein